MFQLLILSIVIHQRMLEKLKKKKGQKRRPGIDSERVQTLADISRSALCCHSNESCAGIANPPNNAQLGTP